MTESITEAHIKFGAEKSIGEVLKMMRDDFVGFFNALLFTITFLFGAHLKLFSTIKKLMMISPVRSGGEKTFLSGLASGTLIIIFRRININTITPIPI